MKRKRLEAWATADLWGCRALYHSAEEARPPHSAVRRVRLVECGPDETVVPKGAAAVVRAAVKWFEGSGDIEPLALAVERMQKGRRK